MGEDTLINYLMGLFPPSEVKSLGLILIAVMAVTQALKRGVLVIGKRAATVREIYLMNLACTMGFGWFGWPVADPVSKTLIVALTWYLSDLLARRGLALLRAFFPRIYLVVQGDRRKQDGDPPGEERRDPTQNPKL